MSNEHPPHDGAPYDEEVIVLTHSVIRVHVPEQHASDTDLLARVRDRLGDLP